MKRMSREYSSHLFVAQEARKDARAGDHLYANTEGERFTVGGVLSTARRPEGAQTGADRDANSRPDSIYPLVSLCRAMRIAEPIPEHPVCTYRRWRFDYAWPLHMLALEIEGGIWTQGRHTRGSGAIADLEKYSEAAILGWRVIYCTPDDLMTLGLDRARRALAMTK